MSVQAGQVGAPAVRLKALALQGNGWLLVLALLVAIEWGLCAEVDIFRGYPPPPLLSYLQTAFLAAVPFGFAVLIFHVIKMIVLRVDEPMVRLRRDLAAATPRIVAFSGGLFLYAAQLAAYTGVKTTYTSIAPFWADRALAAVDHSLFGTDPWRLTHAIAGRAATEFIDRLYEFWVLAMLGTTFFMLAFARARLVRQAILSQALSFLLTGTILQIAFASAGPAYFHSVTGDPRFDPLMALLRSDPSMLTPHTQDYLWNAYRLGTMSFGAGISAMPSMHVAGAVWMALVGWRIARPLGLLASAYAGAIYFGSIHLGWHYATDGIVSAFITIAIWFGVAKLEAALTRKAPKTNT